MNKLDLDPKTQAIVDAFDSHARKRAAELLPAGPDGPLQRTREIAFCLGYKAGVVDLNVARAAETSAVPQWAVSARYAGPWWRPANRRHPAPEDFRRCTVVGSASIATVEGILDSLDVPGDLRAKIRAQSVVQDFVNGKLVPDEPYPLHAQGARYVSDMPDAPLVEWTIEFAFVTRIGDAARGGPA